MKLPKPKYAVPALDYLHFLIQTVAGFVIGFVLYSLAYAVVQMLEHEAYMNSDAKEYVMSTGVKVVIAILKILLVHIVPIVFQSIFLRQKANDQYEDSDSNLMWLSKGLRFMLPVAIPYAVITGIGCCMEIVYTGILFMPPLNFIQLIDMIFGHFLSHYPKMPVIPIIICYIVYMAIHIAVLLFVYRYFWQKWGHEKNDGKLTMSADAYMSHPENDNK